MNKLKWFITVFMVFITVTPTFIYFGYIREVSSQESNTSVIVGLPGPKTAVDSLYSPDLLYLNSTTIQSTGILEHSY